MLIKLPEGNWFKGATNVAFDPKPWMFGRGLLDVPGARQCRQLEVAVPCIKAGQRVQISSYFFKGTWLLGVAMWATLHACKLICNIMDHQKG